MKPKRNVSTRGRLSDGSANPIDIHVGSRMRLRRTLLGLSQEGMAGRLGLTFQQVQKYEKGANRIGCSRLYDIAAALDVPISYFFDDLAEDAAASSPAGVITGKAPLDRAAGPDRDADPMTKRETLELVRAYYAIRPPLARPGLFPGQGPGRQRRPAPSGGVTGMIKRVHFEDRGQDLLWLDIKDAVIVDGGPYHGRLFRGRNTDPTRPPREGSTLNLEGDVFIRYPILRIELREEVAS